MLKEAKPMLLTSFYIRKERTIPIPLYKPKIRIIWIQKTDKDLTKSKKKLNQSPWFPQMTEFLTKYLQIKFIKNILKNHSLWSTRLYSTDARWFNILNK